MAVSPPLFFGLMPAEIVEVDDVPLTVQCVGECGDSYDVETDALGDGCVTYVALMAQRLSHLDRDGFERETLRQSEEG